MKEVGLENWNVERNDDTENREVVYMFLDSQTINKTAESSKDLAYSLKIAAGELYDHQIGPVETKRNENNDGWLVKCYVSPS